MDFKKEMIKFPSELGRSRMKQDFKSDLNMKSLAAIFMVLYIATSVSAGSITEL